MDRRGKVKVNILGTEYEINMYKYHDKPIFEKREIDGYCDGTLKEIAYVDLCTYPGYEDVSSEKHRLIERLTLRHEIVHAFLNESGLQESSGSPATGWATNEEMVDWIALQFPKMLKAFQEADCL
jgi:hypothetical protein